MLTLGIAPPMTQPSHPSWNSLISMWAHSKPEVSAFMGAKLTGNILVIHADLIVGKTKNKSALIYLLSTRTLFLYCLITGRHFDS